MPNGNYTKREELLNQSAEKSNNSTERSKSVERSFMEVLPAISNKNNQSLTIKQPRRSVVPITSIKRTMQAKENIILDKNRSFNRKKGEFLNYLDLSNIDRKFNLVKEGKAEPPLEYEVPDLSRNESSSTIFKLHSKRKSPSSKLSFASRKDTEMKVIYNINTNNKEFSINQSYYDQLIAQANDTRLNNYSKFSVIDKNKSTLTPVDSFKGNEYFLPHVSKFSDPLVNNKLENEIRTLKNLLSIPIMIKNK